MNGNKNTLVLIKVGMTTEQEDKLLVELEYTAQEVTDILTQAAIERLAELLNEGE